MRSPRTAGYGVALGARSGPCTGSHPTVEARQASGGGGGRTVMERGASSSLRVRVPAKINLHLAVGPRRSDGYHDVVSVMQTVTLYDTLRLTLHDDGHSAHPSARRRMRVSLTLDGDAGAAGVPAGGDNLVLVAARRLMAHLGIGGVNGERTSGAAGDGAGVAGPGAPGDDGGPWSRLHLTKRIPVAAGMAGGSADAAAALVGLNRLWSAGLDPSELCDLAALVGSDVPFCVVGGTALATGTGTSVASVLTRSRTHWVIGIDHEPLSTAAVYAAFDDLPAPAPSSPDPVLQALLAGDVDALAAAVRNDLEPAAVVLRPALVGRRDALLDAGALAAMVSGSGPTMLGLARDAAHAAAIADAVRDRFDAVEVVSSPAGGPEFVASSRPEPAPA
jgi:4-diphosphocytidyl-2-C-methyl-D-erythritol kinase